MLKVQQVPGDSGYLVLLSPGLASFSGALSIHGDKMLQSPPGKVCEQMGESQPFLWPELSDLQQKPQG